MNNLLLYNKRLLTTLLYAMLSAGAMANEVLKDPTMPLFNVETGAKSQSMGNIKSTDKAIELVLQGIIDKSGQKFAVINNQVVKVGQVIEGYELTKIVPYGAELKGETEQLSLSLQKVNIKKTND